VARGVNKETKARMHYSLQNRVGGMRENNRNKRDWIVCLNWNMKLGCVRSVILTKQSMLLLIVISIRRKGWGWKAGLEKKKNRFEMKEILQMNSRHVEWFLWFWVKQGLVKGYEFSCLRKLYLMIMYEY